MPLKDEYLDLFCVLEPQKFNRDSWIKLANKFPNLIEDKFSKLIDDLYILEAYDFSKSPKEKNLYKLWGNFAERIGFKGDFKFCKKFTDNSC